MVELKTKEKILHAAIELFNDKGTARISTNHIAAAASISPGNLYYHFRNKEEIIQGALGLMFEDWGLVWRMTEQSAMETADMKVLKQLLLEWFELEWKYRFFYRELVILVKNDPELAQIHLHMQDSHAEEQQQLFDVFMKDGLDAGDIQKILTVCWVFSNYWISFLESNGQLVTEKDFNAGVDHILFVLRPYLKQE